MAISPRTPPRIDGPLDAAYLRGALRRAGRSTPVEGRLETSELTGGRTGTRVTAIRPAEGGPRFVLKVIPRERGLTRGLGNDGEGAFWLAGTTRDLPDPLLNPTLDVALHEAEDAWWVLMDDLSPGIVPRDGWTSSHTRRLFEGLAALHATHWEDDASLLGTLEGSTRVFVEPMVYVATGEARAPEPWVPRVADEFPVPRLFLPTFLEVLGKRDAAFLIAAGERWPDLVTALQAHPTTALHGDPRRANISFLDGRVGLFDWELASRGPAAVDLTWHWFLHYWAYPPDDSHPDDRLWLREAYLDRLEELLGHPIDRERFGVAWDLGWLRVFLQLGFVLVDPLTSPDPPPEQVDRVKARCREAATRARRIVDAHVG